MRTTQRVTMLFLLAVMGGCQSNGNEDPGEGELSLALSLPGSVTISAVSWQVLSSTNTVAASGTIDTSHSGATGSVSVGVATGTGYTVKMSATTSTGASCMGTSNVFNVSAGTTVSVPVTLNCSSTSAGAGLGSVMVSGTVVAGDNCPALQSWMISPQQTAASGGAIEVSATASDQDTGDTLTYAWSATGGSFAAASSAATQYVCGAAGMQTLTLTISDNHSPTPCSINVSFPQVTCSGG